MSTSIADRVTAGAAWLDEHQPGWWQHINLDTLQMAACERCILGQLYGSYSMASNADVELIDAQRAGELGFLREPQGARNPTEYDQLGWAWAQLILSRRAREGEL